MAFLFFGKKKKAEAAKAAEQAKAVQEPVKEAPAVEAAPEEKATGNATYSEYKKSFTARMIQSPAEVQERYEALKNELLSYKKVHSRVSWSYDSFKCGQVQLAKFLIHGKTLCLFLAIDPSTLEESKYNVNNVGGSKKYETVPCRLRLTSKRSVKWGLELIALLAEKEGLVKDPKFKPQTYVMPNESTEALLAKGLVKKA